jgi:hypothetical protein
MLAAKGDLATALGGFDALMVERQRVNASDDLSEGEQERYNELEDKYNTQVTKVRFRSDAAQLDAAIWTFEHRGGTKGRASRAGKKGGSAAAQPGEKTMSGKMFFSISF